MKNRRLLIIGVLVILSLACEIPITITRVETAVPATETYYIVPAVSATAFQPAALEQTDTPVMTNTAEVTGTATLTSTLTLTFTITPTVTNTQTGTITPATPTLTPTITQTSTVTMTMTITRTATRTLTFLYSPTTTSTRTITRTPTATILTNTRTITRTATTTSTPLPPAATSTSSATPNSTLVVPNAPVSPMELINAMNALRVGNGYPALTVNPILMSTAQWTAEYMAANHLMGHIGNVRGRVADAGYGSGATVYATENWAMGFTTLAQIMVAWSDAAHMYPATMSYYVDIGAGVATGPWGPYYVLHAAYSIGTTNTPTVTRSMTPIPTSTATPTATSTSTPTATVTAVPPTATTGCSPLYNSAYESQLVDLINQQRAANGLAALTAQSQLSGAALEHSLDMACNNFFSHTGSDGTSPFDRILNHGYSYSYAGENIYAGGGSYDSPQAVVDAWMASAGHRDNILSPTFTQIGIGYVYNASSDYGGYFTAVFASP